MPSPSKKQRAEAAAQAAADARKVDALGPTERPKPDASPKSKSGRKCVVACKIPNGLILRLFKMVPTDVAVMGGGTKTVTQASVIDDVGSVRVNGPAVPFGKIPKYLITETGYALTSNVDRDFMEEWLRQNKDHDAVRRNLIFMQADEASARDATADHEKTRSGLEPLVPDADPRNPRAQQNLTAPATADERKGKSAA